MSSPLAARQRRPKRRSKKARAKQAKEREEGFSLQFQNDRVPEYQALFDRNLRSHFENKRRQRELYQVGVVRFRVAAALAIREGGRIGGSAQRCDYDCRELSSLSLVGAHRNAVHSPRATPLRAPSTTLDAPQIDKEGRVIDLEKYKSKLFIIDQEFKSAEAAEARRAREEVTTRDLLRKKRRQKLDESRRQDGLQKMKEDRKIRQEILAATRGDSVSPRRRSPARRSGRATSPAADSFFLTDT